MRVIKVLLVVGLSWALTFASFFASSSSGEVYRQVVVPRLPQLDQELTEVGEFSYLTKLDTGGQAVAFDVFFGDLYVTRIGARSSGLGFVLSWQHAFSLWPAGRAAAHRDRKWGESTMLTLSPGAIYLPYARDLNVLIPRGAVSPWLKVRIGEALQMAGVQVGPAAVEQAAREIANEIDAVTGLERNRQSLAWIAFALGPIQFVTLWLFFVSLLMLLLGIFRPWAGVFGEKGIELLPYVGFFGTLLGMSNALQVLGQADLSDSLSKAVNLGPIGSQLSVAIETTKYALVLFMIATLIAMMIESYTSRREQASDTAAQSAPLRTPTKAAEPAQARQVREAGR